MGGAIGGRAGPPGRLTPFPTARASTSCGVAAVEGEVCVPAFPRARWLCYDRRAMRERLPELVGRAMIDPEFLAELQRTPETVLARYELSDDERTAVLGALGRLATEPAGQRGVALRNALLKRVAT